MVAIEDGEVMLDAINNFNFAYTSNLHIGTPPQTINCLFDTGSANAWILSKEAVDENSF